MDTARFDSLARTLASALPRRRLTVAALALVLLGRSSVQVAASCKNPGRKCDKNRDCCAHADCKGGTCTCQRGFAECGNDCVKTDSDENNCGRCGTTCAAGETCCAGSCVDLDTDGANCGTCGTTCTDSDGCRAGQCASCAPDIACDGVCVNPRLDPSNCGGCGIDCGPTRRCLFSNCVPCTPCGTDCCTFPNGICREERCVAD